MDSNNNEGMHGFYLIIEFYSIYFRVERSREYIYEYPL